MVVRVDVGRYRREIAELSSLKAGHICTSEVPTCPLVQH